MGTRVLKVLSVISSITLIEVPRVVENRKWRRMDPLIMLLMKEGNVRDVHVCKCDGQLMDKSCVFLADVSLKLQLSRDDWLVWHHNYTSIKIIKNEDVGMTPCQKL